MDWISLNTQYKKLFLSQIIRNKRILLIFLNSIPLFVYIVVIFFLKNDSILDDLTYILLFYLSYTYSLISYGMLIASWDFPIIPVIAKYGNFDKYIYERYTFLIFIAVILQIIPLFLSVIYIKEYLFLVLSTGIYNVGFVSLASFLLSTVKPKYIDINKHRNWSFSGISLLHVAFFLANIFFVAVVIIVTDIFFERYISYFIFILFGITGLLLRKYIISFIIHKFRIIKYYAYNDRSYFAS